MVLYHNGFGWARGGFLGVSLFFTLSGFLITTLLLSEGSRDGRVDLRGFWVRRFRRLTPAAVATLALIGIVGLAGGWSDTQAAGLRTEIPAAILNVANWGFILSDRSYAALFTDPSPVHHFWSLAIEEQFYLVLPLLIVAMLRFLPAGRWLFATVLAVPAFGSVAWGMVLLGRADFDRVYLGTDVRIAELLAGAILAVLVFQRHRLAGVTGARIAQAGGLLALAAIVLTWWRWTLLDPLLFNGGLVAHAAAVCVLIMAVLQTGPLTRVLGARPLVALGRISYGVYLLHWPVHVLATPERLGLGLGPTAMIRAAITLVLAVISYRLVEQPIRHARTDGTARRVGPALIAVTAAVLLVATPILAPTAATVEAADPFSGGIPDPEPPPTTEAPAPTTPGATTPPTTLPPPSPLRILIVGDSVGHGFAKAMYGLADPDEVQIIDGTGSGCATIREGESQVLGAWQPHRSGCAAWEEKVDRYRPDAVFINRTLADLGPLRLGGGTTHAGLPDFDDRWRLQMTADVSRARATGASVVLGMPIRLTPGFAGPASSEPRYVALRTDLAAVAEATAAPVIDVQGELDALGISERTDGVHLADADADAVAERLLASLVPIAEANRAEAGGAAAGDDGPGGPIHRPILVVGPSTLGPLMEALRERGVPVEGALADCPLSDTDLRPECLARDEAVTRWAATPGLGTAVVTPPFDPRYWPDGPLGAINTTMWWLVGLSGPETTVLVTAPYEPLAGVPLPEDVTPLLRDNVERSKLVPLDLTPGAAPAIWANEIYAALAERDVAPVG